MPHTHDRLLSDTILKDADRHVRATLETEGFGTLAETGVQAMMKKKLVEDMQAYPILGACDPKMARRAMEMDPRIGAMLPCNGILRGVDGGTEVSAVDPVAPMSAADNADPHQVAGEVREMPNRAVNVA